jgi:chromosome segregation ATPase
MGNLLYRGDERLEALESFRRDVDKALPLMNAASVEIDNKLRAWRDTANGNFMDMHFRIEKTEDGLKGILETFQHWMDETAKVVDELGKGIRKINEFNARLEEGFNNLVANQETLSTKQEGYAVLLETVQKRLDILSLQVEPKGVGSGKIMLKECGFENPAIGGMPETDY